MDDTRKENEIPVACVSVTLYASQEKITDPSGSGITDANEFFSKVGEELHSQLETQLSELTESEDWSGYELRAAVNPIT